MGGVALSGLMGWSMACGEGFTQASPEGSGGASVGGSGGSTSTSNTVGTGGMGGNEGTGGGMPECSSFVSYNPGLRRPLNHASVRTPGAFFLAKDQMSPGGTVSEAVFCYVSGMPPLNLASIDDHEECPNKTKNPTPDFEIHPFGDGIEVAWKIYLIHKDGTCSITDVWDFTFKGASRVLELDFNGNLDDKSGLNNNGSALAMNTPAFISNNGTCNGTTIDGIDGQAACFDGSNDFVTIADADSLASPKTVVLWIRPLSLAANGGLVDKLDGSVGGPGFFLSLADMNGRLDWTVNNSSIGFSKTISQNVWSHVVVFHEAGAQALYLNGEPAAAVLDPMNPNPIGANDLDLVIGANKNGSEIYGYFSGLIGGLILDNDFFEPEDVLNGNCWRHRAAGLTLTENCLQ